MQKKPKIIPPVYFFICALLVPAINLYMKAESDINLAYISATILCSGAGSLLVSISWLKFRARGTTYMFDGKVTKLVQDYPYNISRNPMYLGMALILTSGALATGNILCLLAPSIFVIAITFFILPYEESVMEEKFGAQYLEYKKRSARWI